MKTWFSNHFVNTMGPSSMALVAIHRGRPHARSWTPIKLAVQIIGGRRWTISFIRFEETEHGDT